MGTNLYKIVRGFELIGVELSLQMSEVALVSCDAYAKCVMSLLVKLFRRMLKWPVLMRKASLDATSIDSSGSAGPMVLLKLEKII